jgi:hypothetical protein
MLLPFRKILTAITGKKTIKPDRKMWSQKEAITLFKKHGFAEIKIINYNVNLFHYPFNKIVPKLCIAISKIVEPGILGKISFFSTSFIISAEKK